MPKFEYAIGDKVIIKELERPGRVMAIHIGEDGVSFSVRYFQTGKAEIVYFYADELEHKRS